MLVTNSSSPLGKTAISMATSNSSNNRLKFTIIVLVVVFLVFSLNFIVLEHAKITSTSTPCDPAPPVIPSETELSRLMRDSPLLMLLHHECTECDHSNETSSSSAEASSSSHGHHRRKGDPDFFGNLWDNPCLFKTKRGDRESRWGRWGVLSPGEPIDIVYTWVNGSDPENARLRAEVGGANPNVKSLNQFGNHDELKYSLRSVERFAPWVNHVYIVTSGPTQTPSWLNLTNPKVSVVFHSDIYGIANASHHLPVFNSNSIEVHLHRIPGLTDHYIYLNDDVMFGDHICAEDFYTPRSGYKVYVDLVATLTPTHPATNLNSQWRSAWNGHQLLTRDFGKNHRHLMAHSPQMYNKHIVEHVQKKYWSQYWQTSSNRFRADSDVATAFLYYHYLIEAGDVIFKLGKQNPTDDALQYMFFKLADYNGDGKVDTRELEEFLWALSLGQSEETVKSAAALIIGAQQFVTFDMFKKSDPSYQMFKRRVQSYSPRMFRTETLVPDLSFEMLTMSNTEENLQGVLMRRPKFICINDNFSSGGNVNARFVRSDSGSRVQGVMNKFYQAYFPDKSSFEK